MVGWFGKAAVAASGLCLLATSVLAQPTKTVAKCESSTGGVLAKFVGAKTKCISKCISTGRKTSGPYTDCFSPYAGDTSACITGSLKGAEAKAGAGIAKACAAAANCPTCYSNQQCSDASGANPWVQTTEGDVDAPFGPGTGFPDLIWCTEKGGGTPSKDVGKCEDGVNKALVKFVGAKNKCYAKCISAADKAGTGRGVCFFPGAVDPGVNTCIKDPAKGAEAKAKAAIVKACPTLPGCYTGTADQVANTFVSSVEGKIDTRAPQISCGSPSGAFLQ
ncbi:MAG TPA: hypothetical protein VH951_07060 [Dehalococcoidia bacterium]|jgi:hypothetical protein